MRASTAIILCGAALVAASPLLVKKDFTLVVYETVYTTVTWIDPNGGAPSTSQFPGVIDGSSHRHRKTLSNPGVAPAVTPSSSPIAAVSTPAATFAPPVVTNVVPLPTQPASTTAAAAFPSAPANAGIAPPTDYKSTCLYHHNIHRANHSSPALMYDDTLAGYALQVASTCIFAHDLSPGGGGYGQNIADQGTTDPKESQKDPSMQAAAVISDFWYNGELYEYPWGDVGKDNPSFDNFDAWGHFSQVVWKGTLRVGCATVYCAAGAGGSKAIFQSPFSGWFTVCNYGPAGNMGGQYGQNVFLPEGDPTVAI